MILAEKSTIYAQAIVCQQSISLPSPSCLKRTVMFHKGYYLPSTPQQKMAYGGILNTA
jgi:hypothetical protein